MGRSESVESVDRESEAEMGGGEGNAMTEGVRRVVTGRDAVGRSVILSDERAVFVRDPGGSEVAELWSIPAGPLDPESGEAPAPGTIGYEPPPGAIAWRVVRLAPPKPGTESDSALPDLHRSDTLDWMTVLSQPVELVLEAESLQLEPGDCVVQGGVAHAWRSVGDGPGLLGALMLRPAPGDEPDAMPVGPRSSESDQGCGAPSRRDAGRRRRPGCRRSGR